jgi:hypothetical protein
MKHTKETVKDLAVAIDTLPGKVIGWNEERGVYNLEIVSSGGTNEKTKIHGVGKSKFELDKSEPENYMRFSYMSYQLKHLMGEVLTTIEASIHNEKQCDAVKSIIKKDFGRKLDWIYENCACPEEEMDFLMSIEE